MLNRSFLKTGLIIALLLQFNSLFAQLEGNQRVVSTAGNSALGGGLQLDYTVGEPVMQTFSGPGIDLTQGFQQPSGKIIAVNNLLSLGSDSVVNASCPQAANGKARIKVLNGTAPISYVWVPNVSVTDSATGLGTGNYLVTAVDANGKSGSVTVTVGLDTTECYFKFYTGITPNNDGKNDQWNIEGIETFGDNTVRIFNRWGNEIWSGSGYNNTTIVFKGKNLQGVELTDGTYFYTALIEGLNYKGWFELTR